MASLADKIAKIIAKAESSTHPEEAEVFMAKAQQMMEEHGLSLLDLGKLNSDDPVGHDREAGKYVASESWTGVVATALARYYGATVVTSKLCNHTFVEVFGRESARVTFTLMLPFVVKQVRAIARAEHKAGNFKSYSIAKTRIGNSLAVRLSRMAAENAPRVEGSGVNALVPVDLVEQLMLETYPKLKPGKPRPVKTNAASRAAAERVNIHRQAEGATVRKLTN